MCILPTSVSLYLRRVRKFFSVSFAYLWQVFHCRMNTVESANRSTNIGSNSSITVGAPFMSATRKTIIIWNNNSVRNTLCLRFCPAGALLLQRVRRKGTTVNTLIPDSVIPEFAHTGPKISAPRRMFCTQSGIRIYRISYLPDSKS